MAQHGFRRMSDVQQAGDFRTHETGQDRIHGHAIRASTLFREPGQIGAGHVLGHDEGRGWILRKVDDLAEPWPMKIEQLSASGEKTLRDSGVVGLGDAIGAQELERDQDLGRPRLGLATRVRRKMGQVGFAHAARAEETLDDVLAQAKGRRHGFPL